MHTLKGALFFVIELFLQSFKTDTLSKHILKQMRIEDSITFTLLIFQAGSAKFHKSFKAT